MSTTRTKLSRALNAFGCVACETTLNLFSLASLALIAPNVLKTELQWACIASVFFTTCITNAAAIINPEQNKTASGYSIPKSLLGKTTLAIGLINTAFVFWGFTSGMLYTFLTILGNERWVKGLGVTIGILCSYTFAKGYYEYIVRRGQNAGDRFMLQGRSYFQDLTSTQRALLSLILLVALVTAFSEGSFAYFIFGTAWNLYCSTFNGSDNTCQASSLNYISIIPALTSALTAILCYTWAMVEKVKTLSSELDYPILQFDLPENTTERKTLKLSNLAWIPILFDSLSDGLRNTFSIIAMLMLHNKIGEVATNVNIAAFTALSTTTYLFFNSKGVDNLRQAGAHIREFLSGSSFSHQAVNST